MLHNLLLNLYIITQHKIIQFKIYKIIIMQNKNHSLQHKYNIHIKISILKFNHLNNNKLLIISKAQVNINKFQF